MKRLLLFCVACLFWGCMEREELVPSGSQLLRNTDLSNSLDTVSPWNSVMATPFNVGVSDEVFFSGNRSLFLEGTTEEATGSVAWVQHYTGPMPFANRRLRLRAMMKGENIELNGINSNVWVTVRAWPAEGASGTFGRSVSSQRTNFISGTFDWTPFELTLPNFPNDSNRISVFLVMGPRTTGKIYFDEITLTVE